MRISWGIKITLLYIGFVALVIVMVSTAMNQKVDLVSQDYYEQELKYQSKIDKSNHAQALEEQVTWKVGKDNVVIHFPRQFRGQQIGGSIYFFRPSDAAMDRTIEISTDTSGVQVINTNQLSRGLYKVQISWKALEEEYYNEGIIQVN